MYDSQRGGMRQSNNMSIALMLERTTWVLFLYWKVWILGFDVLCDTTDPAPGFVMFNAHVVASLQHDSADHRPIRWRMLHWLSKMEGQTGQNLG